MNWFFQPKLNCCGCCCSFSDDEKEDGEELGGGGGLSDKVSLYKGDITVLEVDAIVNAGKNTTLGGVTVFPEDHLLCILCSPALCCSEWRSAGRGEVAWKTLRLLLLLNLSLRNQIIFIHSFNSWRLRG